MPPYSGTGNINWNDYSSIPPTKPAATPPPTSTPTTYKAPIASTAPAIQQPTSPMGAPSAAATASQNPQAGYDPKFAQYGITPEIWQQLGTMDLNDPNASAQFTALMSGMNGGIQAKNALTDQKNAVVQAMLGGTVDPATLAKLPPDVQSVVQSGNRDALMLQASALNDQIRGYNNSVSSSLSYLVNGYQNATQQAEKNRTDALTSLMDVAKNFVDPATGKVDISRMKSAMQSMYPGVNLGGVIDQLQGLQPVTEFNKALQYPFITPGSSGQNGSTNITSLMQSIGQTESGGDYSAIGKPTANGSRAYGKYQIMDFNIPSWTQEALGKSMTSEEFRADPQAQDQTAQYMLNKYLTQYGNAADAASMWFSGVPAAESKGMKDVNGTSAEQYINDILKGIPSSSGTDSGIPGIPDATTVAQQLGKNPDDPAFGTAFQMVTGNLAPAQVPRRSTGSQSWLTIMDYANKISQQLFKKPFNAEQADASFTYLKSAKTQATLASLNYTITTLNQLKGLSQNVDRSSITFGNQAGMWVKYNGSDPNTVDFITKVNGSIDDLGAALGGGVSTDKKLDIAKSIIDPTLSNEAFQGQMNVDLGTVQSRIDAINQQAGVTSSSSSSSSNDPLGLGI